MAIQLCKDYAQEWYTAADLSGLPGMPGTPQNVHQKAAREGWNPALFDILVGASGGPKFLVLVRIAGLGEICDHYLQLRHGKPPFPSIPRTTRQPMRSRSAL